MLNVLIVDDDAGDRKSVTRALKQAGLACECIETVSVPEALDACHEHAFDCAIVDYRMPGVDGLHGISALHQRVPNMPIIMATGQGDEMIATEAMQRGASDYISKGRINAESIRRIIENAVEKGALRLKVAQQQEELENFASVLVHDLKAPLCSMQGFVGLIELRIKEGNLNELAEYGRRVVQAVHRMNEMIDTVHEYTTTDAQVTYEPIEARLALEATLSNLAHVIQKRRARITHDDLPVVIGNASQLIQLLQNLIDNGLKYCEAEFPSIHVAVCPHEDATWLFSVRDNGIGIPEKYYKTVFQAFKRLPGASAYNGTGLGLATCKKIVDRHGGRIWCESTEGRGTTFFFTLRGVDNHA